MTTETNSERLERIKSEWNGDDILCVADTDWLIEQAELLHELEKEMKDIIETADVIDYRNQVMREALKFYADEESYNHPLSDLKEAGSSEVMKDAGYVARQALGESHAQT